MWILAVAVIFLFARTGSKLAEHMQLSDGTSWLVAFCGAVVGAVLFLVMDTYRGR